MKKLLILALLIFAAPLVVVGQDEDALNVQVTLVTGERSRDSNSTVTTISIIHTTLVYKKIYRGRPRNKPAERKEFKIRDVDKANLIALIKEHALLRTEQIEREESSSGIRRYFALSLNLDVNGKKGLIQIQGPRDATDIKDEKLYEDAVALVKEIFVLISSADDTIVYQPPID